MSLPAELLPDPFTATYVRVREAFFAHRGFASLVSRGTFMDFTQRSDWPNASQAGDHADIAMVQRDWRFMPKGRNSRTTEIRVTLDLLMMAGVAKLKVTKINALKWQSCIALAAAGEDLGLPEFIRDVEVIQAQDDAFGQAEFKRDNHTYVSVVRVIPTLSLPRDVLRDLFVPLTP